VYAAPLDELVERAELNPDLAARIVKKSCHGQAEQELKHCLSRGIVPIASDCEDYPALLRESHDYPHVIYFMGDISALGRRRMLSMVGTRRMTSYGQKVCDRLIGELSAAYPDLVIVSGLAFGIDGACHRSALANGLATVGVLANHITEVYPAQHAMLASEMIKRGGGILSEYHSASKNKGVTFLARNRIIAGMSAGTIVVESPANGGSLITAHLANGYERSVMAAPGRIGDTFSEGTNSLIASNRAKRVCSAADIARELMWDMEGGAARKTFDDSVLSPDARGLLGCIKEGESVCVDSLADVTGLTVAQLAALLFELEMEGAIKLLPGKLYERA
jgi:DNA processing protein